MTPHVSAELPKPNPSTDRDGESEGPPAAQFEVEFLEMTIDHNGMALHISDMCLEKAVHPEFAALCRSSKSHSLR